MAQWTNLNRNSSFINPLPLPMLCEISGPVDLAEPGLTAGWQAGWQADEIQVNIENFRSRYRLK